MVFVNTHLSYEATHLRAPQFDLLATWLPADKPYVVMGDFNTEDQGEFSVLTDMGAVMVNTGDRLCKTFRQPPTAIDHILYHPQSMILVDSGMVDRPHSDHNLFYATFQINYPHP